MQKFWFIVFLVMAFGCNKDDDPKVFKSISGHWIVRTPDNTTTITFNIGTDSNSQYVIENAGITHNGASYSRQPIDARIIVSSDTQVESITLRTDDFIIRLLEMTVNSNFTEMQISNSIWTISGVIREFPMINATRK